MLFQKRNLKQQRLTTHLKQFCGSFLGCDPPVENWCFRLLSNFKHCRAYEHGFVNIFSSVCFKCILVLCYRAFCVTGLQRVCRWHSRSQLVMLRALLIFERPNVHTLCRWDVSLNFVDVSSRQRSYLSLFCRLDKSNI